MILPIHSLSHASPCDPNRLQRLVDDRLADSETAALAEHLSHCETCCHLLDAMQPLNDTWPTIREILIDDQKQSLVTTSVTRSPVLESDHSPIGDSSKAVGAMLSWLRPSASGAPEEDPTCIGYLDHYHVRRVLGHGGMGIVMDAWDPKLRRTIAIKSMHPHLAANGTSRQRFVREARAAAAVVHPNVVAIHSVHDEHHPPYLVMPLIDGETLQSRLDRCGPLDVDAALRIAGQIADGLAAAHAQGLIHRDIKPANILLEHGTERALITDFGVARALNDATVTASGMIPGTPEYMSPEQASGDPLDSRSDLFSLGCVLYAMLSGHSPFRGESPLTVLKRVQNDTPRPLAQHRTDVDASIQRLLDWLLNKHKETRISDANTASALFRELLAHRLQPAEHDIPVVLRTDSQRTSQAGPLLFGFLAAMIAIIASIASAPQVVELLSRQTAEGSVSEAVQTTSDQQPDPLPGTTPPLVAPLENAEITEPGLSHEWLRISNDTTQASNASNWLDKMASPSEEVRVRKEMQSIDDALLLMEFEVFGPK